VTPAWPSSRPRELTPANASLRSRIIAAATESGWQASTDGHGFLWLTKPGGVPIQLSKHVFEPGHENPEIPLRGILSLMRSASERQAAGR
jgi:hypothetical protein